MIKDLCHESNATLLSSLLNIPAENLACKNISDILTAPMSITGVGTNHYKFITGKRHYRC